MITVKDLILSDGRFYPVVYFNGSVNDLSEFILKKGLVQFNFSEKNSNDLYVSSSFIVSFEVDKSSVFAKKDNPEKGSTGSSGFLSVEDILNALNDIRPNQSPLSNLVDFRSRYNKTCKA